MGRKESNDFGNRERIFDEVEAKIGILTKIMDDFIILC